MMMKRSISTKGGSVADRPGSSAAKSTLANSRVFSPKDGVTSYYFPSSKKSLVGMPSNQNLFQSQFAQIRQS